MNHKQQLKTWLSEQDRTNLICRDLAHAWLPCTARKIKGGGFERTLICDRCSAIKAQVLDKHAAVLKSSMKYAVGYTRPKGAGRLTAEDRAALRLALFTQGD